MIFADPTYRRVYILSVILLAVILLFIYLKIFNPDNILAFRYMVLGLRFKTIVIYNRIFEVLLVVNFIKLFFYAIASKKPQPPARKFTPFVTAVIPAYNEEKMISVAAETLSGILDEAGISFELLEAFVRFTVPSASIFL